MDALVGNEWAVWTSVLVVVFLVLMATRYVFSTQPHEGDDKKDPTLFHQDNPQMQSTAEVSTQSTPISTFGSADDHDTSYDAASTQVPMSAGQTTPVFADAESSYLPNDVWVIQVVPKHSGVFAGYDLLESLSHCHVHLSEKNIFARYEDIEGTGELWYYIASLESPGTFDMQEPGRLQCKGLVLILNSQKVDSLMDAYSAFVTAAKKLARDLEGEMLDDKHNKLNDRMLNQWHQSIFEQKKEDAMS